MMRELFVDNFAGWGGASSGIEGAIGRSVDIAINHDPDAIAMHRANHPATKHYCEDVWQVDPKEACGGNPVALAWFSPDCKHFSRAKGGKPVDKNIRGLAWVAVKWAYEVRPRCLMLENVPEFQTWGPLTPKTDPKTGRMMKIVGYGHKKGSRHGAPKLAVADPGEYVPEEKRLLVPDPNRAGEFFDGFVGALSTGIPKDHPAFREMCEALEISPFSAAADTISHGLGYTVEFKVLKSCDFGAPTSRTRFYMIARCDGEAIEWPEPTHAHRNSQAVKSGAKLPYRTAAECIDWSIPTKSIFGRSKPLAENTLHRIARGIQKFVVENPKPFIVPVGYGERVGQLPRVNSIEDPLGTVVSSGKHYLVTPYLTKFQQNSSGQDLSDPIDTVMPGAQRFGLIAPTLIQYHDEQGKNEVRGQGLTEPIMTLDTSNRYALSCAHIMKYYAGYYNGPGSAASAPLDTVTTLPRHYLVTSHIMKMKGTNIGHRMDDPLQTITAGGGHFAEVQAFLLKYYGSGIGQSADEPLDTVTAKDRFAVITIHGEEYIITDIRMRMLQPRELFNAQGVPENYVIDKDADGKIYSKSKQVKGCGNMVTPPVPAALVRANLPEYCRSEKTA